MKKTYPVLKFWGILISAHPTLNKINCLNIPVTKIFYQYSESVLVFLKPNVNAQVSTTTDLRWKFYTINSHSGHSSDNYMSIALYFINCYGKIVRFYVNYLFCILTTWLFTWLNSEGVRVNHVQNKKNLYAWPILLMTGFVPIETVPL